jgi:hypothetical protein
MRPASSAIPRGGCWPGWSTSISSRCPIPRWATTSSSVGDYVAKRRPEIAAEAGRAIEAGFVPQTHLPGAEAEVDFADLWIDLRGVRAKVFLFKLRLSCSGCP